MRRRIDRLFREARARRGVDADAVFAEHLALPVETVQKAFGSAFRRARREARHVACRDDLANATPEQREAWYQAIKAVPTADEIARLDSAEGAAYAAVQEKISAQDLRSAMDLNVDLVRAQ